MGKYGVTARLVWDGGKELFLPEEMGTPRADQLQGTIGEKLSEAAGRICYDSCGTGRSSKDFHPHILGVGHFSVYEHHPLTIRWNPDASMISVKDFLWACANRPGLWIEPEGYRLRLTFNPRVVLDWAGWNPLWQKTESTDFVGKLLRYHAEQQWPQITPCLAHWDSTLLARVQNETELVEPYHDEEKWISIYFSFSRGASHEQVRHGDRSAISQRCLSGDSIITFANRNGWAYSGNIGAKKRTLAWLYERMQDPRLKTLMRRLRPRVLDEKTGLFGSGRLLDVVSSGKKPCFEIELEDGKMLKCTEDHRIWTKSGWKTLKEIAAPQASKSGVVSWNKEGSLEISVNGLQAVGNGFYRDATWMRERVAEGKSDEEISALCGARPATVKHFRVSFGLKRRILRNFSASPVRNKKWLEHCYRTLGMSHEEISKAAGCNPAVVHNWCRKYGIQKSRREINLGRTPWNKGKSYSHTKPYSPESIERYRLSKLGSRNPHWKGGKHSEERRAFQAWKRKHKTEVFARDGWRCRLCDRHSSEVPTNGKHLKKRTIEIHHIMPLWNRPDLACDKNNMATICWECQAKRLNGHEFEYVEQLLRVISSPLPYQRSTRTRPQGKRVVRVHFRFIKAIRYAGLIDTYDMVLEGPNHGFVANGIVVHNSTRFVDESESPWIEHPLEQEYAFQTGDSSLKAMGDSVIRASRAYYSKATKTLEGWLISRGADKLTARKQARGAARGKLGNALETQMIFSASVGQWHRMIRMRCHPAADAEIRAVYVQVLEDILKKSRYADDFKRWKLTPSADGMGHCAVEEL